MITATSTPIATVGSVDESLTPDWTSQLSIDAVISIDDSASMTFLSHNNAAVRTNELATVPMDFGDEFIYDRTWIIADRMDYGSLLATQVDIVSFWNAYRDIPITLNTITGYLDNTGTAFGTSTLPASLAPTEEKTYTLTTTLEGAAVLDCYYLFDNDSPGTDNRFEITGTRILFLPFKHDWNENYAVKYATETIISGSPKLYEQRRPMFSTLSREIKTTDVLPNSIKTKNYLKKYNNRVITIPIVIEEMTINLTGSVLGLTTLPINEIIADFWHLAHSGFVVLWNTVTDKTEICKLNSYTTSLVLDKEILSDWDVSEIVVYPIMFAILANVGIQSITDKVDRIEITAKEFPVYV